MNRRGFLSRITLSAAAAAVLPLSALLPKKSLPAPPGNPIFSGSAMTIDGMVIHRHRSDAIALHRDAYLRYMDAAHDELMFTALSGDLA